MKEFQNTKCLQDKHLHRVILYHGQVVIEGNLTHDSKSLCVSTC